jgi:8-oxo-dGTP pyrophosphatase MutT (NUDIX family)
MIGALLWYPPDSTYLLLRRAADRDVGGGAWECVTGRLRQGEGFSDAVHREVYEELGVEVQIDFIIGTAHFHRGDARPENEMVGVQYCCSIHNPEAIRVSAEHSEYHWVTAEKAEELLPDSHWLRKVIARVEATRSMLPSEMLDLHRRNGFEL